METIDITLVAIVSSTSEAAEDQCCNTLETGGSKS